MLEHGIVIINKERGYTSQDVVAVVKRTLRMKAGHTGTLDPMAEGVLPVCLGRATKLAGFLTAEDKTYLAEVRLGVTTDTLDITGEVRARRPVEADEARVREVTQSFMGAQLQTPPMYSAVKVNGRKLYELARRGQEVEREARPIVIHAIHILAVAEESFTMEVRCSKGTYIRSLCADIGERLGCGACLSALTRTQTGAFTLDNAVRLATLAEEPSRHIIPVEEALPLPTLHIKAEAERAAVNGNPLPVSQLTFETEEPKRAWAYLSGVLLGLYIKDGDRYKPEVYLFS